MGKRQEERSVVPTREEVSPPEKRHNGFEDGRGRSPTAEEAKEKSSKSNKSGF